MVAASAKAAMKPKAGCRCSSILAAIISMTLQASSVVATIRALRSEACFSASRVEASLPSGGRDVSTGGTGAMVRNLRNGTASDRRNVANEEEFRAAHSIGHVAMHNKCCNAQ